MPKAPSILTVGLPASLGLPTPVGRPEVLLGRAQAADLAGRREEAIGLYRRAVALDPFNTDAMTGLAIALSESGRIGEAIEQFNNVLRVDPNSPFAWKNRAAALERAGRFPESLACHDRVIALCPDLPDGYLGRAHALCSLGRFEEAALAYDRVLPIAVDKPDVRFYRAMMSHWLHRSDEALRAYDAVIADDPNHAWAPVGKALLLLAMGRIGEGFALYESHHGLPEFIRTQRALHAKPWLGETGVAGKTILLYGEQGMGDSLQFCRYATLVAEAGARVILEVERPLAALLATVPGVSEVVAEGDPPPDHDLSCPLMSLPLAFGTTLDTIPAAIPYVRADPQRVAAWRGRLAGLKGRRVGLVWAGGSRLGVPAALAIDQRRSVALATLAPLARVEGVSFVSLQLGPPAEQTASPPAGMALHDPTADLRDFADTAALIENLDLVISVDTSTAHLAGALGRPVWLLDRFDACWRWMLDREDSPWYPTLRIFRQPAPGDWASVAVRVAAGLRAFAAG